MKRSVLFAALALLCASVSAQQPPAKPRPIKVIMFAGVYNLPAWVAQRQGFFQKHGVAMDISYTPNSIYLMQTLIDGRFDVAMTGIDNLIAYQEGQGEAPVTKPVDLVAFMGLSSGFLSLVAQPDIKRVGDLRGKPLAVDALTTGFAFVLREMIARAGLTDKDVTYVPVGGGQTRYHSLIEGKQAAGLLNTPFAEQAAERGLNVLGTGAALLGNYQGHAAFAQRAWLKENEAAVIGLMRAYRDAMEWLFDPKNRQIAEAILIANDAGVTPTVARRAYDAAVDPKSGLYRDLAINVEGVRTVLALRSKYGTPQKTLNDPMKYVDPSFHQKAFASR